MNELSLFTGYGGFSLALQLLLGRKGVRTIGYCEIEPYCQDIIKARIRDGLLDDAPIWPDIRSANFSGLRGLVDIVTAGFPCQPHSVAGKRAGALDKRNLWPDTLRVIDDLGPAIVLLENVPGILANGYAGIVVGELAERGYDAFWGLLSAASVGAPHVRTRWWCLAYPNRFRAAKSGWRGDCLQAFRGTISLGRNQEDSQDESTDIDDGGLPLAYTQKHRDRRFQNITRGAWNQQDSQRWEGMGDELSNKSGYVGNPQGQPSNNGVRGTGEEASLEAQLGGPGRSTFPPPPDDGEAWREVLENDCRLEPALRGMADGPPHRVDRLKALGNGIVPLQAAYAIRLLAGQQEMMP